jgi:hypothetical protein
MRVLGTDPFCRTLDGIDGAGRVKKNVFIGVPTRGAKRDGKGEEMQHLDH